MAAQTQPQSVETKKPKPTIKYLREKDREMVKGIFKFYECPGATMSFVFKKYKEDPLERFDLIDGQIYTVPLGVAKHLNNNGKYPIHAYMSDENGKPIAKIGQKVARFGFQSLEFVDVDDFGNTKELLTVEVTGL